MSKKRKRIVSIEEITYNFKQLKRYEDKVFGICNAARF